MSGSAIWSKSNRLPFVWQVMPSRCPPLCLVKGKPQGHHPFCGSPRPHSGNLETSPYCGWTKSNIFETMGNQVVAGIYREIIILGFLGRAGCCPSTIWFASQILVVCHAAGGLQIWALEGEVFRLSGSRRKKKEVCLCSNGRAHNMGGVRIVAPKHSPRMKHDTHISLSWTVTIFLDNR